MFDCEVLCKKSKHTKQSHQKAKTFVALQRRRNQNIYLSQKESKARGIVFNSNN